MRLNSDLSACGTGTEIAVEFTTNEHGKPFESSVSYADLGIVVRREHSMFGPAYSKAIIVQSKKLYGGKDGYQISSRYGGFDRDQFSNLKKLGAKYDWGGVVYFLYNPALEAFSDKDREILRALEFRLYPQGAGTSVDMPFWHPEIEYSLHKMMRSGYPLLGLPASSSPSTTTDEIRDIRAQAVTHKPGLRVLGIVSVADIVEDCDTVRSSFSLQDCYQYALSSNWWGSSGAVPFLSLSSYIVNMFLGCARGSDNESIVRIAEGKLPSVPEGPADDDAPGIAVRHTLKITFRSTLPERDVAFFRQ